MDNFSFFFRAFVLAELSRKSEENNLLMEEVKKLKNELDDVKSQLVVDSMRESDFEVEKRKADEEIASLQRLIHGECQPVLHN